MLAIDACGTGMSAIEFNIEISSTDSGSVSDCLVKASGLPRARIKDAMGKGAVWLSDAKGKQRRLRRASLPVKAGTRLLLYYDARLLSVKPPVANCLHDQVRYSVWYKPPGLMAQGTLYGDHCSLLRQTEQAFRPMRQVFLVHRLDREAAGLMLIAHDKQTAAQLSQLFQHNGITKHYRISVLGDMRSRAEASIDLPLDGKSARTHYKVLAYDTQKNVTHLQVTIETGRKHQIRRHFDLIGFPVMGDPRYGQGNKNAEGLCLIADSLAFKCPVRQSQVVYQYPETETA